MSLRVPAAFISAILGFVVFGTTVFGADLDATVEHRCAMTFGTTGADLPSLLQAAIKVFPKDRYALRPDQVVYLTDFNGFVNCLGIKSESTRNFLFRQELIVLHNDFPIYFNPNEDAVSAFRTDGRVSYLKYIFASFLGNGWIHATGEKRDSPAYSFELTLLQGYKKKLPAGNLTEDHFDEVRNLIEKARQVEQISDNDALRSSTIKLEHRH